MKREDFIQHYVIARATALQGELKIDIVGVLEDANRAFTESIAHYQSLKETAAERYADKRGPLEKMMARGFESL